MNAATIPLFLAAIAGVLMAVQAPTNALLSKASGSPVVAAFISFVVGTAALGAVMAIDHSRGSVAGLRHVPWYAWLGGFYGAFFVAVAAFAAPRLGVGVLLTAAIAGQLLGAMILDHFGLLGLSKSPITAARLAGIGLVLVGVLLVRRG